VKLSAPGKRPQTLSVEIAAVADQKSLLIPRLEDAPAETAPPAPTTNEPLRTSIAPSVPERDALGSRPIPTSVYVAGGITLALAAGAGVTCVWGRWSLGCRSPSGHGRGRMSCRSPK
jgi:hypothetical protein